MRQGIFVCTPCYGSKLWEPYFASAMALKEEFVNIGMDHGWFTLGNESLVTRARNVCASSFLKETEFSHLLFIDADIEFSPEDVSHLWNLCDEDDADADVSVGAYRIKEHGAPLAAWVDGKLIQDIEDRTKPFEVDYAGTGFMMIPRKTFQTLIDRSARKTRDDIWDFEEGQIGQCWNFFDTGLDGDFTVDDWLARNYLPEDYMFCKRVIGAGMKIVMHPKIKLKHHGNASY